MELKTKQTIRKKIKELKKTLSENQIDELSFSILEKLYETDEYKSTKDVYTYVNYNQEVKTTLLIENALLNDKRVFVPRILDGEMEFYRIKNLNDLKPGAFNIPEPDDHCEMSINPSGIMIMPGLAFDREHRRIGYGGGYYDKYLSLHSDFIKVVLCYDFQVVEKLETEEYDIPVDIVITETQMF